MMDRWDAIAVMGTMMDCELPVINQSADAMLLFVLVSV